MQGPDGPVAPGGLAPSLDRPPTADLVVRGAALTVASMLIAQTGLAPSVRLLEPAGALGAAWLRLGWAALVVLAFVRPWRFRYSRAALRAGALLGVATAGMLTLYMAAALRIPLGTASVLQFCGPLVLAALAGRSRTGWVWPVLAAGGVVLLTEPWRGEADALGVLFGLGCAACYAAYVVLTQRVGREAEGLRGLAVSFPVAAVVATLVAAPTAAPLMTPSLVVTGLLLAVLVPVLPFALELSALRRLRSGTFATLLCFEPGFALLLGVLLLGQVPGALGVVGMGAVITAGVGATRREARSRSAA